MHLSILLTNCTKVVLRLNWADSELNIMKLPAAAIPIVALLFVSTFCSGQDFVFKILASKGQCEFKKAGSATIHQLMIGSELFNGDQIIAGNDAYLGLLHHTGKTIEIDTPGVHEVSDLQKKVPPVVTSISKRWMDFVTDQINSVNEDNNYRENLKASAGVQRAIDGDGFINLMVIEQKKINRVYGDNAIIRWVASENVSSYTVKILSIFGDILSTIETTNELIELNFDDPALNNERLLSVKVESNEPQISSLTYQIQRISNADDVSQITEALNEFSDESSTHALMLALFYEERGLYLNALTQYERAAGLSPDVEIYGKLRNQFIISSKLNR